MFEAYKVAVKVSLKNEVSAGLIGLSGQFKALGREAEIFQAKLNSIKKIAFVGAGFGAAGFFGLDIMSKALKPAEEYAHILNVMNIQGLKHQEIAEAVASAWKTTNTVVTSTVTGNLKNFIDLKNIFRGNIQEAISYLPEFAKLATVLGASSNIKISGNAHDLAFSVAKALDIRGAITPAEFTKESEMMSKVIIATQGRVLPQDYQMMFKYGRQSTYGLSNEFLYQQIPTLMMEMKTAGGGSGSHGGVGTSLAAGYRYVVQGIMTKAAFQALANLGLEGGKFNDNIKTTTTRTILKHGVKGAELFQMNPFLWTQNVLLPALHTKYGENLSRQDLIRDINNLRMTQTASFAILQYALKAQQIYGDQRLINRAVNMNTAYQMSLSNDPNTVYSALSAQWDKLKLAFGMGVIPIILPIIMKLTTAFQQLGNSLRDHPFLTRQLAIGLAELFVSMVALGGAILTVSIVLSPVTRYVIALAAAFRGFVLLIPALIDGTKWWMNEIEKFFHVSPNNSQQVSSEGSTTFYHPGSTNNQSQEIHHHIFLDTKQVAHTITREQGRLLSKQPNHGSVYNPNISLQPNMLNYGNAF
jgi:hypothetical protein